MSDTQKFHQVGEASADWSVPTPDGIHRRTLVTGAAWAVPVIAIAVATPLAAASQNATLAFVEVTYSADNCQALGVVTLEATGDPSGAGQTITVTLPTGLAWADGTTDPKAFGPTDSAGRVAIPAGTITTVGDSSGSYTLFASSDSGATATAPVTVIATGVVSLWDPVAGFGDLSDTLLDATPVGYNAWLRPNGDLWVFGTLVATGVTDAVSEFDTTLGGPRVSYSQAGGPVTDWDQIGGATPLLAVPADAKPVGYNVWLTPGGELWFGETLVASGVTDAVADFDSTLGIPRVSYSQAAGPVTDWDPIGGATALPAVPADAKPVGYNVWLTPGGELWFGENHIASGVTDAVAEFDSKLGVPRVSYTQSAGPATDWDPIGGFGPLPAVPADAKPVGYNMWLTPGGDLWFGGTQVASGVTDALSEFNDSQALPKVSVIRRSDCF